jgi:hypothetical protein
MAAEACTRPRCLPVLVARQCFGCGSRRVRHDDLAGLTGAELVDGVLRYDPKRVRVRIVEDICAADCPGLPLGKRG